MGWKEVAIIPQIAPYARRKDEIILLHVEIPLWGTRDIIPKKLLAQDRILKTIHEGQIGVVKMKGLPRGHVRCLKDKDIERTGRQ